MNLLGGPEMYKVARREFTAGDPGKRIAKRRETKPDFDGAVSALCALRACTTGQV